MTFKLPKLPYSLDSLKPYISRQTLEFHYGKHHQAYVNNLNQLLPGSPFEHASLETIVREADGGIFNNGAQVWNHTFYFLAFSPTPAQEPQKPLMDALVRDFGSLSAFKESFSAAAAGIFGSGWSWMVKDDKGKLEIVKESNAGNPLRNGLVPLLTCDVWEHAYYLDYQNRRLDYIQAFWNLVDWNVVSERYQG